MVYNQNTLIFSKICCYFYLGFLSIISSIATGQPNLLCDPSFDSAVNIGGQFPLSGCWIDNHLGQAGAVVDGWHFSSPPFSLHIYTGSNPLDSLSTPTHITVPIEPGFSCHAEVKICTPAGFSWQPGSAAFIRLSFLNSSNQVIYCADGPIYQNATPSFQIFEIDCIVPDGSTQTRFSIHLIKPNVSGQSIINVDDCLLTKTILPPIMDVEPPQLSFGAFNDTLFMRIKNTGGSNLSYSLLPPTSSWFSIAPASGNLAAGEYHFINVTATRDSLSDYSCNQFFSNVQIYSSASDTITIPLNISTPCGVPDQSAIVTINGSQLIVQKRLSCEKLSPSEPYSIKGFCWSPASVETTSSHASRRQAFEKWSDTDLGMIYGCNANTIYTFLDFGMDSLTYKKVLDCIYENGLMAIITVDVDGTYDTANLREVVAEYKNHPAILLWAIGNEWNINLYHNYFETLHEAAEGTELAAQIIKSIDTLHPVASIYGDINIPQSLNTDTIINELCPSVDIWGLNIYRGQEFYDLFEDWDSITGKPMFLSEFGIDSYHTVQWDPPPPTGYIDELEQKDWNHILWMDINPELSEYDTSKQCLGGTYFEWNDEYWKVDLPGVQNTNGFYTYWNPTAFPDAFANEEFFGIIGIDSNKHISKKSYSQISIDFYDTLVAKFDACDTSVCIADSTPVWFFDLSSGFPTQWLWNFGDGTESTLSNPVHIYQNPGSFTVTLVVSDNLHSSSVTKTNYIVCNPQPEAPVITLSGDSLCSNAMIGNQWFLDGVYIEGDTLQCTHPATPGEYWDVVTLLGCGSDTSNHIFIDSTFFTPENADFKFQIVPNPTSGLFKITVSCRGISEFLLNVFTTLGHKIYEEGWQTAGETCEKTVDLRHYSEGLYFIVLTTIDRQISFKLILCKP